MGSYILAINPGSTSTKFALYDGEKPLFEQSVSHSNDDLSRFEKVSDQKKFRKEIVLDELLRKGYQTEKIEAVVGRGGLLKPIESGIYEVNEKMKNDLIACVRGSHASNLGGLIASEVASEIEGARAFIVDPVVVDELDDVARIAGHPYFERNSIFHALNQKAVSRLYAASINKKYEDINLVVAHMGGGISVGAHRRGRVVDVNNALNGDGPFTPERSGSLPTGQMVELCFSGKKTKEEILGMLTGQGGMVSYLGTNDFRDVCKRVAEGDEKAKLIQEAASYQVAKEIGAMSAVLKGEVDAIILTGGMAYQKLNTDYISNMVASIAPIVIYPGEDELKALAFNGLLVLSKKLKPKIYS